MAKHLTAAQLTTLTQKALTLSAGTAVTAATNANPIVVTSTAHGLTTGDVVFIAGAVGNTAANGVFTATVVDANTFSIAVAGNGAWSSGGTVKKVTMGTLVGDLTVGDLEDIESSLSRMNVKHGNDANRAVESTLATLFATAFQP
jgi:hypothetical protein